MYQLSEFKHFTTYNYLFVKIQKTKTSSKNIYLNYKLLKKS